MRSEHSRRIDPIGRSARPFCQGEAGAIGLSRILCVPKTLSELDGMIGLLSFVLALLASPFKSKLQLHVCSIFDRN